MPQSNALITRNAAPGEEDERHEHHVHGDEPPPVVQDEAPAGDLGHDLGSAAHGDAHREPVDTGITKLTS